VSPEASRQPIAGLPEIPERPPAPRPAPRKIVTGEELAAYLDKIADRPYTVPMQKVKEKLEQLHEQKRRFTTDTPLLDIAENAADQARAAQDLERLKRARIRGALVRKLKSTQRRTISMQPSSEVTTARAMRDARKAERFIGDIWSRDVPSVLYVDVIDDRPSYTHILRTINIKENGSVSSAVHEIAHAIELNDYELRQSIQRFYARRTIGEDPEPLGGWYRDDEVTRPDKWADRYMGKAYPDSETTELLSMGLEWLYEKPRYFAMRDPEMFDFIVRLVQGEIP
jgi:hypothetical protein